VRDTVVETESQSPEPVPAFRGPRTEGGVRRRIVRGASCAILGGAAREATGLPLASLARRTGMAVSLRQARRGAARRTS